MHYYDLLFYFKSFISFFFLRLIIFFNFVVLFIHKNKRHYLRQRCKQCRPIRSATSKCSTTTTVCTFTWTTSSSFCSSTALRRPTSSPSDSTATRSRGICCGRPASRAKRSPTCSNTKRRAWRAWSESCSRCWTTSREKTFIQMCKIDF